MTYDDAIQLRDVRFSYKPDSLTLGIDELTIASGRRVFLHGPSGSGKTTLLSIISGVLTPQSGSVHIVGQDLKKLSASGRDTLRGSRIGYIFQGFNLIPYLTVAENIALPCQLHPIRRNRISAATVNSEVARLARRLEIHTHLDAPVTELSTGQQQRVAIARAIIGSPELVIADEPTSSLDTDRREAFLDLLNEVITDAIRQDNSKTTLLFVSHDRSLANHFDESISLEEIATTHRPESKHDLA
ncbi:ABC transporter ATP-binding protein [Granulicella mallensis]|uniref:Polyamine-transporting ATPase n=1 Tax=Granulicella mallensis (strain ATCC BAA-1857 / DSM 23137 / MP5ACTX8) TaxID=682795 RepID=G8NWH0_GRAMM|nr:ABC transporter ATP-binding protein [Granulicella mallensis]AEU37773.1 Polyamine-transporting ATPase [Granulicella mallensis MP5ACTX8]